MSITNLPACRDCKHCFSSTNDGGNLCCRLFAYKEWQAETGKHEIVRYSSIEIARASDAYYILQANTDRVQSCGREGRLFESKPTLITRLYNWLERTAIIIQHALPQ